MSLFERNKQKNMYDFVIMFYLEKGKEKKSGNPPSCLLWAAERILVSHMSLKCTEEGIIQMEAHGQLSLGHLEFEMPFKSNCKVFGKMCPNLSNSILCNDLSSSAGHNCGC